MIFVKGNLGTDRRPLFLPRRDEVRCTSQIEQTVAEYESGAGKDWSAMDRTGSTRGGNLLTCLALATGRKLLARREGSRTPLSKRLRSVDFLGS
jgi:hypothetical protein